MKLLKPLLVPWMIAPSLPKLTLISEEDGTHFVKFRGFFGFEGVANNSQESVIVDGVTLEARKVGLPARYQLISLKFDLVGWFRRSPQYSDSEVIRETDYDWSCVPGVIRDHESVTDWRIRFLKEWNDSRICPNSGVYVVENSDWDVGPDKARFNLNHFLIVGESCFIEILAKGCTWMSEGNIDG